MRAILWCYRKVLQCNFSFSRCSSTHHTHRQTHTQSSAKSLQDHSPVTELFFTVIHCNYMTIWQHRRPLCGVSGSCCVSVSERQKERQPGVDRQRQADWGFCTACGDAEDTVLHHCWAACFHICLDVLVMHQKWGGSTFEHLTVQ